MPTTTTGIATEFIQFTRASNATVTDSDGLIKWAPHNLLTNSESFNATAWTKSSITPTANSIAAPNGTTTADTLAATGANGTTLQTFTAEAISYTFGVWLKRKTGTGTIEIAADSGTYTAVTITSDWALYTVTQTPAAGSKSAGIRIVTSADEVYAWGAALYRSDLAMQPNTSAYPMYNPTTPKNLLGYTESLTTGWTNSNTTDAIVSEINPAGLTGAVNVAATAGNGTLLSSLSLLASPYTFSIWLKRNTGSGTVEITVDGTTYVAAAVTGTWTRFSTTLTPTAGTKTPGIRLVTSGDAVYAWGAQLSDSASLDTYAPVYGAAVTSAAYYGPRRDFNASTLACNGLLVEEQRTNLALHNTDFSQIDWEKINCTASAHNITDPNGTSTASTITATSADAYFYFNSSSNPTGSIVVTASAWIRRRTGTGIVSLRNDAGSATATTLSLTSSWQRVQVQVTASASTASEDCWVLRLATSGDAVDLWLPQLEVGSGTTAAPFMTSVIPTGAATATRNADVASVSTQAFPYSQTDGTLVFNFGAMNFAGDMGGTAPYDGVIGIVTNGSRFGRQFFAANGNSWFVINRTGTPSASSAISGSAAFAPGNGPVAAHKLAMAISTTDMAGVVNGGTVTTTAISSAPTGAADLLYINSRLNGHIRQITYLPRRISNAELVTRST